MKNFRLFALSLLLVLVATANSFSQEQGTFSYHFGAAIPSGNFADDDIDDFLDGSGGAGLGLNFGIQYVYALSDKGLGLFIGADINYNPLNKDVRDDMEGEDSTGDITYPKYLNIPISAGLTYKFKVNEKVAIYGKGGLAASFMKPTNLKYSERDYEYKEKYDLSTGLGTIIGGGIVLNDKIELGVTFMGLGKHKFDSKWEEDSDGAKDDGKTKDYKTDVALTTLTIGFKF